MKSWVVNVADTSLFNFHMVSAPSHTIIISWSIQVIKLILTQWSHRCIFC